MSSRFLLGAGAWLLGAACATAGSLYAVAQLGQGLVAQHTGQVSVRMVNAELAQDGATAASTSPASEPSSTASPKASHSPATRQSGRKHHSDPPVTYASKWLTSDGGTAYAACGPGGAQLRSWFPAQGFEPHDVVAGPTTVALVTFIGSSIGVVMKVTCSAGVPVAHLFPFQAGGVGWRHDE